MQAQHQSSDTANATTNKCDEFYLQDSRNYVGNDILFWAKEGKGYTTDISNAEVYTRDRAFRQHATRDTDIPWPKHYVDAKARLAVDMQDACNREALAQVGAVLPQKPKPEYRPIKCYGCGRFLQRHGWCTGCQSGGE